MLKHSTVFGDIVWTAESFNGVLFHWNLNEQRLSLDNTRKTYYSLLKLFLLQGIILTILIFQGHLKFQPPHVQENLDFTDYFPYAICVLCNVCNYYCTALALFIYRECNCYFINGLAQFHSKYSKYANCSKDKTVSQSYKVLYSGERYMVYSLPATYYPSRMLTRCTGWIPASRLCRDIGCCQSVTNLKDICASISRMVPLKQCCTHLDFYFKKMIVILNHWLWAFGYNAAVLAIGGMMLMCTMTKVDRIDR